MNFNPIMLQLAHYSFVILECYGNSFLFIIILLPFLKVLFFFFIEIIIFFRRCRFIIFRHNNSFTLGGINMKISIQLLFACLNCVCVCVCAGYFEGFQNNFVRVFVDFRIWQKICKFLNEICGNLVRSVKLIKNLCSLFETI